MTPCPIIELGPAVERSRGVVQGGSNDGYVPANSGLSDNGSDADPWYDPVGFGTLEWVGCWPALCS